MSRNILSVSRQPKQISGREHCYNSIRIDKPSQNVKKSLNTSMVCIRNYDDNELSEEVLIEVNYELFFFLLLSM